jgi:hypothetical protein
VLAQLAHGRAGSLRDCRPAPRLQGGGLSDLGLAAGSQWVDSRMLGIVLPQVAAALNMADCRLPGGPYEGSV